MQTILVTGSTGNLGRAVVAALATGGFQVRAAARDPGKLGSHPGVEPVRFVYEQPDTHAPALSGVDGLFLIAPPLDPEAAAKLNPVIDLARRSGVRRVVLTSALGVDAVEEAPLRRVERHLMASGLPFTILRPNFFMENFSTGFLAPMVRQGGIWLAAGDGKTSFISVEDIAAVAVAVFRKDSPPRECNLTGPEALDHAEVAAILSRVTGRSITYHALTEEQMLENFRRAGLPEGAVQYAANLYRAVRAGHAARITPDVEQVSGRKPMTFREFAQRKAAAWR
ncbi:SDR family oxidoreductase [Limisphaera sp. VF-2]|jgi:uncharacterized protein YbjT (DUF2867 family)|uniref:SDR family oxidoreductase n=1 Tax=Limisphaera sp. VF-2 TaxID=3400418 RepID=UPI00177651A2|nr:SDR family oxidoreductase [Limisphaera sp.]